MTSSKRNLKEGKEVIKDKEKPRTEIKDKEKPRIGMEIQ